MLIQARVRSALTLNDWSAMRVLCCETGDNGAPIADARWFFFSEQWIGPYQALLPQWSFVAEDKGHVIGYLTGCPDTRSFERSKITFDLGLAAKVLWGRYQKNADTQTFLKRRFTLTDSPKSKFNPKIVSSVEKKFPAHLHVNLGSEARGMGLGRKLCERFFLELKMRDIPGVHVYCGADPVPFYKALGFEIQEQIEFKPGKPVFLMTKTIT